jgi:hypothetical protein
VRVLSSLDPAMPGESRRVRVAWAVPNQLLDLEVVMIGALLGLRELAFSLEAAIPVLVNTGTRLFSRAQPVIASHVSFQGSVFAPVVNSTASPASVRRAYSRLSHLNLLSHHPGQWEWCYMPYLWSLQTLRSEALGDRYGGRRELG